MKRILHSWSEVLRNRNAAIVLVAAGASIMGDSAAMVALVLRTHDLRLGPYSLTVLLACFALPVVALMGPAGTLADRIEPRRVLVAGGLVQVAAATGLAWVTSPIATCMLVLVMQTGFALSNPVWSAVMPRLVGAEHVGSLISLQQGLRGVASPLGAALGGVLIQWHGSKVAMLFNAVTFMLLTLAGAALRLPRLTRQPIDKHGPTHVRGFLLPRAGIRALRTRPVLWTLVIALLPIIVTLEAVNVIQVFLVRDTLGATAATYGAIEAVQTVAGVLGSLAASAVADERRRVRVILGALGMLSVGQILQGLSPDVLTFTASGSLVGLTLGLVNALIFALLLNSIAEDARGSVMAFVNGASRACSVVALVLGGILASTVGPRPAYVALGAAGIVVTAIATLIVIRTAQRDTRSGII